MNIPDLRFRGFEDEWVEKTIGDIAKINNGYDYKHLESGEIPVYGTGGYMLSVNRALSCVDAVGIGRKGTIDRPFILNAPFWTVDTLFYVTPNNDCDLYFLLGLFLNTDWKKRDESTGVPSLSKSTIEQVFTFQSSLDEQKKIGKVFERYDNLLTQCERRQTTLLNLKRALLDKMFPKDGNDVPEIRFAGFDGAWENFTLGDLGSVAMNRRIFKYQTSEQGEIPFYKIGTFGSEADAYISRELFEEYKRKYPYPKIGDILISAAGSIGKTVEYKGEDAYFQDSNIVWLAHDSRLDSKFLKAFYSVVSWAGLEGSTIKRLYNKNILETSISLPTLAEQQAIGRFFSHLDTLISLESQKLSKLRQLKKALLKRMFV